MDERATSRVWLHLAAIGAVAWTATVSCGGGDDGPVAPAGAGSGSVDDGDGDGDFTGASAGMGSDPCVDPAGEIPTCDEAGGNGGGGAPGGGGDDSGGDAGASTGSGDDNCGPGMTCKPGSIRYCDVSGIEWTKSECGADGTWGPCLETTAPSGEGCDADSYSPEECCPPLFLCCQDDPDGPFVDFGSGACAAGECR